MFAQMRTHANQQLLTVSFDPSISAAAAGAAVAVDDGISNALRICNITVFSCIIFFTCSKRCRCICSIKQNGYL